MVEHLIIGGGVYGAAVAWELASRGEACRLLEARRIGAGASSGRGAGAAGWDAAAGLHPSRPGGRGLVGRGSHWPGVETSPCGG